MSKKEIEKLIKDKIKQEEKKIENLKVNYNKLKEKEDLEKKVEFDKINQEIANKKESINKRRKKLKNFSIATFILAICGIFAIGAIGITAVALVNKYLAFYTLIPLVVSVASISVIDRIVKKYAIENSKYSLEIAKLEESKMEIKYNESEKLIKLKEKIAKKSNILSELKQELKKYKNIENYKNELDLEKAKIEKKYSKNSGNELTK